MNKYLSDFVDYFKNLSVQHPDLEHSETVGEVVFEVAAYEQAFSDFRTAEEEKAYFVRFILPTMRMEPHGNNAIKKYQVGLMVGKYYSRREGAKEEIVAAWSDAERVADDFIARMLADSRNGYPLFNATGDSVAGINLQGDFWDVQGDGSWAAVLYFFDIGTHRCLSPNDVNDYAEWLDGGLTVD